MTERFDHYLGGFKAKYLKPLLNEIINQYSESQYLRETSFLRRYSNVQINILVLELQYIL